MNTSLVDEEDLVQKGCNSRYNTFTLSIPMVSLTTIGQILILVVSFKTPRCSVLQDMYRYKIHQNMQKSDFCKKW